MVIQKLLRRITNLVASQQFGKLPDVDITPCEQRLAFSAIPFAAGLHELAGADNHELDLHSEVVDAASWEMQTHLIPPSTQVIDDQSNTPIANHLSNVSTQSAAHALTGLDVARQRFGLTGIGQTVAIIDTGIAYDHLALGGGYGPNARVVGGYDFAENDANPYDDAPAGYHGTAVAGVVGGSATGVAPGVDLVALRVFNDLGQGTLQSVESALRWIQNNHRNFENPISIVNLSLGVDFNTTNPPAGSILEDELLALKNEGILVIASAGNSFAKYQTPGLAYPASSPHVLSVASVDANGQMSSFSQRDWDSLAAPGRNISSTVPDYMLGADGNPNDYSTVSGTSFSAPYVAGASALLRQAYELVGINDVTVDTIRNVLFSTADSVFDSITNSSFSRLNILRALDSILPDDAVGNTAANAFTVNLGSSPTGSWSGFINEIGDADFYQWTATTSGTLELDFNSNHLHNAQWLVTSGNQVLTQSANGNYVLQVVAGATYTFGVSDSDQIGMFNVGWNLTVANTAPSGPQGTPNELGTADIQTIDASANGLYAIESTNIGTLSVQLRENASLQSLRLFNQQGQEVAADRLIENGVLRVDFEVQEGVRYLIQTGFNSGSAKLDIANIVTKVGSNLTVQGTTGSDDFQVDLSNGLLIDTGAIDYRYASGTILNLELNLSGGSDKLAIAGSQATEAIYLYSNHGSLQSPSINIAWSGSEAVNYNGRGGSDRVYAFDTDGNDQLTIHPNRFQLDGAGYQFVVTQAERLFVDASRGGNDQAYMFDSAGDDTLSVRPQFSSIRGAGFFSFVTGFERVYAYATAGGNDTATLYDSVGNDSFATNGDNASIVGNNYFAYTRFFENVESISSAGGHDTASIFSPQGANNFVGSDFVSFQYEQWGRTARGFSAIQASVVGATVAATSPQTSSMIESNNDSTNNVASNSIELIETIQSTIAMEGFSQGAATTVQPIDTLSAMVLPATVTIPAAANSLLSDTSQPILPEITDTNQTSESSLAECWIVEAAEDVYAIQQIDAITASLVELDEEARILRQFFEEFDSNFRFG